MLLGKIQCASDAPTPQNELLYCRSGFLEPRALLMRGF